MIFPYIVMFVTELQWPAAVLHYIVRSPSSSPATLQKHFKSTKRDTKFSFLFSTTTKNKVFAPGDMTKRLASFANEMIGTVLVKIMCTEY